MGTAGNLHIEGYLDASRRARLLEWLGTLHPVWEQRYGALRPPPPGHRQHRLLRPVYWLGNWQFACLGYFEPPRNVRDCAVQAEPFPDFLRAWTDDIEARARKSLPPSHVPKGWQLDTCLVNFYGEVLMDGRWVDAARVGEHKDREPGPVASVSVGERARFQFVRAGRGEAPPVQTVWLGDGDLQVFSGPFWKDQLLHRVQRVEDKRDLDLAPRIDGFRTRRINLTFRHVPPAHVVALSRLSRAARADVMPYVDELAAHSEFWRGARDEASRTT